MKQVFLRYYDEVNLGDDLFAKILTDRYKNKFYIISSKSQFLEKKSNVRIMSNAFVIKVSRAFEKYLNTPNILKKVFVAKSDVYVYVGGSIFIDSEDKSYWESEATFFERLRKPYYILGANYGPEITPEYRSTVQRIIKGAVDICFRDSNSYSIFRDNDNVRKAADVVFSLNTKSIINVSSKTVLVSIIDAHARFDYDTAILYESMIKQLTEKAVASGYKVIYMSFCSTEGDELGIERIRSMLSPESLPYTEKYDYNGDLDQAIALIASSEIVIGTRFHSIILGMLFGKKVLPIAYSNKTIDYLKDANFKGDIVDIRMLSKDNYDNISLNGLTKYDPRKQINLSQQQFKVLDKILERSA